MVNEQQYTSIRRVMDNLMDHPLLRNLTLDQVIRYTLRFIGLHGYPMLYMDKTAVVDINDFRGMLPCDLVRITQVKDLDSCMCLRAMTDNFSEGLEEHHHHKESDNGNIQRLYGGICEKPDGRPNGEYEGIREIYIPKQKKPYKELSFKTQGRIIYTSFPKGSVEVAYKAIPVDENNYPMLMDDETYLAALEAFIKVEVFTIKFDTGKISGSVLQNAQQEYAFRAGELECRLKTPSLSEMETLSRVYNTLILSQKHFDNGFRDYGNREYLRRH
jgi:hypothetical protein